MNGKSCETQISLRGIAGDAVESGWLDGVPEKKAVVVQHDGTISIFPSWEEAIDQHFEDIASQRPVLIATAKELRADYLAAKSED